MYHSKKISMNIKMIPVAPRKKEEGFITTKMKGNRTAAALIAVSPWSSNQEAVSSHLLLQSALGRDLCQVYNATIQRKVKVGRRSSLL